VVVAVLLVGVMQVPSHDEVDVIGVGDALVPAPGAVHVPLRVLAAAVGRRAVAGVRTAGHDPMLVDVSVVNAVQVTVVEIVGVSFVDDGAVAAAVPVLVRVSGMLFARHGVLPARAISRDRWRP
jgi:hypothetical protein